MMSSTKRLFVLILFFSNTYWMREVTSVLAGGCLHAKAELARLCFPETLHSPQLLAALTLQARCFLSCHNSAPANPAPGRMPQVSANMKLHKDLSQPNLVCVRRHSLGDSPYGVGLLASHLLHCMQQQQQQHALPCKQMLVRFIGRVKLKAHSPPVYTMALTVVAGH